MSSQGDTTISSKDTNTVAIKRTLRLYIGIAVRNWKYTIPILFSVAIGSTCIFYIPPLIIGHLINTSGVTLQNAWPYAALFGVVWLIGEMLWRLALHLMIKFELQALHQLYNDGLNLLVHKEMSFYANRFTGTITKNILAFARRYENFFDTLVFEIVSQLFPALFAAIILAFISPWLSAVLATMLILGGFIITPLVKKRMKMVKEREDAHAKMAGHISDVISNIAAIKAFGAEESERKVHNKNVGNYIEKARRSWNYQNNRIDMVISPIYVATNVLGLVIVLHLGVSDDAKASLFIAFSYFANVTRFLWSFNGVYRRLEEAVTDASLFVNYILSPTQVIDAENAKKMQLRNGHIVFDNVIFTHPEGRDALFKNFVLDVQPGQKVGLVGHSGAGKSTIVNLLLRFMDIDSGKIIIDDQDISQVTQQSLHQSIAFVPQEPLLFHRTLRDNIAYGKPHATDAEILEAAKQAHALEFIEQLPEGFDTLVGERGVKLSGGQRQRVAIARAILKDAPILVLDEATSALDSESEKLIQAALERLMKNRTSIVVAHRLSTIAKLDRIIVLDQGTIAEDGSHSELLAKQGIYAKLWNHQSGGFIED